MRCRRNQWGQGSRHEISGEILKRGRGGGRVHERNVDALMACALPYHSTPQFVRLVQVRHVAGAWRGCARHKVIQSEEGHCVLQRLCCILSQ